jgi:hypothetical protein
MRRIAALPLLALAACAGVAWQGPQPGQTEAEVLQRHGAPTGRYTLADGATRLEYATGPFGRTTWMVDVRDGRVVMARQVLNEAHFAEFQGKAPGMNRDELLRTLGRPGEAKGVGWQGHRLWSWRYPTNDCLLFQVTLGADGVVRDAGYNIDPRCDPPNEKSK